MSVRDTSEKLVHARLYAQLFAVLSITRLTIIVKNLYIYV